MNSIAYTRKLSTMIERIPSKLDSSINYFINKGLEARFVQHVPEQVIVYLSSQYGCNQACRMCHLTQMGLTSTQDTTEDEFKQQIHVVLLDYFLKEGRVPESINVNYMARGELLLNQHRRLMRGENPLDLERLVDKEIFKVFIEHTCKANVPLPQVNHYVSTVFPKELLNPIPSIDYPTALYELLGSFNYTVFWSLYSLREAFRKRWLPKAMDPHYAVEMLWDYCDYPITPTPVIHHALIKGENNTEEDAYAITRFLEASDLKYRVNLVRYNPYSPDQSEECSDENYERVARVFREAKGCERVQIVPRDGTDIAASCGQFLSL